MDAAAHSAIVLEVRTALEEHSRYIAELLANREREALLERLERFERAELAERADRAVNRRAQSIDSVNSAERAKLRWAAL